MSAALHSSDELEIRPVERQDVMSKDIFIGKMFFSPDLSIRRIQHWYDHIVGERNACVGPANRDFKVDTA